MTSFVDVKPTASPVDNIVAEQAQNAIILKWVTVNRTGYTGGSVYRSLDNDRDSSSNIGVIDNTNQFSDGDIISGTTYFYWIRAFGSDGKEDGEWSHEVGGGLEVVAKQVQSEDISPDAIAKVFDDIQTSSYVFPMASARATVTQGSETINVDEEGIASFVVEGQGGEATTQCILSLEDVPTWIGSPGGDGVATGTLYGRVQVYTETLSGSNIFDTLVVGGTWSAFYKIKTTNDFINPDKTTVVTNKDFLQTLTWESDALRNYKITIDTRTQASANAGVNACTATISGGESLYRRIFANISSVASE